MHLDADDLLAQIQRDYPREYEISQLRLLAHRQQQEIDRLTALVPQPTDGYGRSFDRLEETRADLPQP